MEIIFVGLVIFGLLFVFNRYVNNKRATDIVGNKADLSVYERKPFLFDSYAEFNLYKVLIELYGDQYYIFTQVNYSHLIQPKKSTWEEERRHRSRIDRKSADFVLCDKVRVVPQLVIELDGYSHNFKSKQVRDELINDLTKIVDLPILHLKTESTNKDFIDREINKLLSGVNSK